jgi:hypothetical protein
MVLSIVLHDGDVLSPADAVRSHLAALAQGR